MVKIIGSDFAIMLAAACFVIILLTPNAAALGVTPGRTTFNFEPGAEKTFSFSIINSENKDYNLEIVVKGELNQSIVLSENSFSMSADESERTINAKIVMPAEMSPGTNTNDILVVEVPKERDKWQTQLGASVTIATEVNVIVPYPGKYIDVGLNVVGPAEDGTILFVLPVVNLGKMDIRSLSASLEIYDSRNKLVASLDTNEMSLPSSQRVELTGVLEDELPFGNYRLVADVRYDDESMRLDKMFHLGLPLLELKQIGVSDFRLGGLARFDMVVENKWNEEMKGAYSMMRIYGLDGKVLAEFTSAPQDIPPMSEATLVSYWDSVGAKKATYDSTVVLNYENLSNEKKFKLEVDEYKISVVGVSYVISRGTPISNDNGLMMVLLVAVVVLVLINTAWFLLLRRKLLRGRR